MNTVTYTVIRDWDRTVGETVESVADDLYMTPAEKATLLTAGAVQINDLIMQPLIVQIEEEPEEYSAVETMHVNDYGVQRWWCNGRRDGQVQL